MAVRFQLRRDTAANWTASNPTLALGEPGVETDTLKVKVGDGTTAWNSLAYSITKDFTDLTSKPTTVAGYGITDALTLTALSVTQNAASGTGALTYNNTTGVFEYTPPDFEGLDGNFVGSVFADDSTIMVDGVSATLNFVNNSITDLPDADQTVRTTDDVEFNKVTTSTIDSSDSSAITVETDVVLNAGLTVGNHIVPSSNENIDLGSATNRFRDIYLSGSTINLGGAVITKGTGDTIQLPVGTNIGGVSVAAPDQGLDTTDNVTFANITATGYLAGPATFVIDPAAVGDDTGTVVIAGDLQVDGTTTTINSTTLEVEDKNVVLGPNAANDAANNGAGITVTQPDTSDATLIYNTTDTQWELNKTVNVTTSTDTVATFRRDRVSGSAELVISSDTNNVIDIDAASTSDTMTLSIEGSPIVAIDDTGINVAGTVVGDGLTIDGDGTVNGNFYVQSANARLRLKETDTTDLDGQVQVTAGIFKISRLDDDNATATARLDIDLSAGDISFYENTGATTKFLWDASESHLYVGDNTANMPTAVQGAGLMITGASPADVDGGQLVIKSSETTADADNGSGIVFDNYNGVGNRVFGSIQVLKENGTSNNNDSYMRFVVRNNTSGFVEALHINSNGVVSADTVSVTEELNIPTGTSSERPTTPATGSTRWNTENNALEIYNGAEWIAIAIDYVPAGSTNFGG